jgi:P4 family phage/plasmid primase-like protien
MNISKPVIDSYREKGVAVFTLCLHEEYSTAHNKWKKKIDAPSKWQETTKDSQLVILKRHNAAGILTGAKSGLFVLDIDVLEHWHEWLKAHGRFEEWSELEKATVTVKTASGGLHYYFRYGPELANIKGTSKCFGGHWEIDSRTTGNFVYAPPTRLVNDNVSWQYTWIRSLFDDTKFPLGDVPHFIVKGLIERPGRVSKSASPPRAFPRQVDSPPSQSLSTPLADEGAFVCALLALVDAGFWDSYSEWIDLGGCIRALDLPEDVKLHIWKRFSQLSSKYEASECERKWQVLPKRDGGIAMNRIKALARQGSPVEYGRVTGERLVPASDMAVVREFLSKQFKIATGKVCDGMVKAYGNEAYMIVGISDPHCSLIKGPHERVQLFEGAELQPISTGYAVIGQRHARIKCHHAECFGKVGRDVPASKYPTEVTALVQRLLVVPAVAPEGDVAGSSTQQLQIDAPPCKLSEEQARELAFEIMTTHTDIPSAVNRGGMNIEQLQQCTLGWNCNLPENKHFKDKQLVRRGDTHLLLGRNGLQMINATDVFNPWPDAAWAVDENRLRKALPHLAINVTINNTTNNNTNNTQVVASEEQTILPCDFEKDGLVLFSDLPKLRQKFLLSLNGVHNAVAKYFHMIYEDRFRCVVKRWYEFGAHTWEVQEDSDAITAVLSSEEFLEPFVTAFEFYQAKQGDALTLAKAKRIDNLLKNLQTGPFKGHVLGECAETFRYNHRDFAKSMDRAYLTPFANGVLDLTSMEFREGRPADNMTKSMEVDFIPYDPAEENEIQREILRWFEQVQPDESLRKYLQKLTGILLTPDVNNQKVWILSGSGRNGKSFFINKVLKAALGSFYGTGATQLLTQKREKANETNEALMDLIGKRLAVFNEPANNEIIQADTLKILSGEDEMTVRGNYAKQTKFTPTFKTFMVCNDRPKMSEDSYAVWRRVRVINWPVRFTEAPQPGNPHELVLDPLLDEKAKRWPPYFAGLMVYWLKLYRAEGLIEPECVVQHTRQYEEEHDQWKEFRDMHLVHRPGRCLWTRLRTEFITWVMQTSRQSLSKDAAKAYFTKHLGPFDPLKSLTDPTGGSKFKGWNTWHFDHPNAHLN